MIDLVKEFKDEFSKGSHLVVMPLSRVLIEDEFRIGKYRFYPTGEVDVTLLRPVPNRFLAAINSVEVNNDDMLIMGLGNEMLRESATAVTGASPEVYMTNPLLSFTVDDLDWDEFLEANSHDYDKRILRSFTREAEKVMDLIKYFFCRADLVDTLPATAGVWEGSNGFSSSLIFNIDEYESYIIAGSIVTHTIVKGIGLELDLNRIREECEVVLSTVGEVGSVVKTALAMHTAFLETNNTTTQFVKAMTLLEFLAYPDDYKRFEDVRKEITPHIAKDYNDYLRLKERFNELTGKKDEHGKHIGYRTRIVHIGDSIEDILGDEMKVNKLMLEIQIYIGAVVKDMINNHQYTWSEFVEYRNRKKISLGII